MRREVLLTEDAERDLTSIYHYILKSDSQKNADSVLDHLIQAIDNLALFPKRGSVPKELQSLGIKEYRQVFFKPYRIMYRVFDKRIVIYLIADDRRDMQTLLAQRLVSVLP